MMPFSANRPKEQVVVYSDLETGYGISLSVKTTTNWAKVVWWDGTTDINEPSIGSYDTFGKIFFFKISDTNDSKRIVVYSTDSNGNNSGFVEMFTCYRKRDKRKDVGGVKERDNYSANQKITKMDVSTCSNLKVLKCDRNNLTSLGDVTACRQLQTLSCAGNDFESIDLSRMKALKKFFCNNNTNLISLNLNNGIERVGASDCGFTDMLFLPYSIKHINMRNAQFNTIDISGYTNLSYANFQSYQTFPPASSIVDASFDECTLMNINFKDCLSLTSVNFNNISFAIDATFSTETPGVLGNNYISISSNGYSGMNTSAIDNMFGDLPSVTSGTILAYGTPEDIDTTIATNKGWTVVN